MTSVLLSIQHLSPEEKRVQIYITNHKNNRQSLVCHAVLKHYSLPEPAAETYIPDAQKGTHRYLHSWKDSSIQEIKITLSHIAAVGMICVISLKGRVFPLEKKNPNKTSVYHLVQGPLSKIPHLHYSVTRSEWT